MRAIRPKQTGGPEVLKLEEWDTPTPSATEVVVRVEVAGLNFIDVYHRTGLYPLPLPLLIGQEGAGVVEQVGSSVRDLQPGVRVAWASVGGSYATHVVAPYDRLVRVPETVDSRTATALMLQGMTAHYLCRSTVVLGPDHVVLIHAAAGGVGLLLIQLAKLAGARVIGTVSTKAKANLAEQAGADQIIDYANNDFVAEVQRITGGRGVDVVFDSVGRATFDGSMAVLALRGSLVLFGQSSGPVPAFDPSRLAKGSYVLTRPVLGHYIGTRADLLLRSGEIFDLAAQGKLRARVDKTFPLAEAEQAHRALAARETTGKVLLLP